MEIFETLSVLNACFGPSGQETQVGEKLAELAGPWGDEVRRDTLGNLIVHRKGAGPRVMLCAHMDSLGLMVTHIQEDGLLRVGKLGGIHPGDVLGTPVRFQSGLRGAVYEDSGLEDKKREIGHLYLDIGAKSAQEARERVQVGDVAVYDTPTFQSGNAIFGPYLDDRIGCAVLLKALEGIRSRENDLYFVFTVQEEVGIRGAGTAAFGIDPDYAVAVDVTGSDDLPGSKHGCSSKCGGGAAIKVMDGSVICHPQMVRRLRELGEGRSIPFQMDVLTAGGTDAGAIHRSRGGVVTGGVSIPCRHAHSPMASVFASDADACAALLTAFGETALPPADAQER